MAELKSQVQSIMERAQCSGRTIIHRCPECKARRKQLLEQDKKFKAQQRKQGIPKEKVVSMFSGSKTIPLRSRVAAVTPWTQVPMPECVCDKCIIETQTVGKKTLLQRQRERELESRGIQFQTPEGLTHTALKVVVRRKSTGKLEKVLDIEKDVRIVEKKHKRKTAIKRKSVKTDKNAKKKDLTAVKKTLKVKAYMEVALRDDYEFIDSINLSGYGKLTPSEAIAVAYENKVFTRKLPNGAIYNPCVGMHNIRVRQIR